MIILIILVFLIMNSTIIVATNDIEITKTEQEWIDAHKNSELHVGLAPYEGIDLFMLGSNEYGYISDVIKIFEEETGLNMVVDTDKSWSEAYNGLFNGDVDILFGANATEERLQVMAFTEAIRRYPYVVLVRDDEEIYSIGDLDNGNIGFIEGDMVIDLFEKNYKNISYSIIEYETPYDIFQGIAKGEIKGGITSNTEIIDELLIDNSQVMEVAELKDLYSDMTFATKIEDKVFAILLDKIISARSNDIEQLIKGSRVTYMHKILRLTSEEEEWLAKHQQLVVGVADDYLPIDYTTADSKYSGVAGEYLNQFAELVGIEIIAVKKPFDALFEDIQNGNIDMLNMAKTDERTEEFSFTDPFSNERDLIYGLKSTEPVYDIYGLEDKSVVVIEGFWHEAYLQKNIRNVEIIITEDIAESLDYVNTGKADYFIENPTVAQFYLEGLGYTKIISKGMTSADSFLNFGVAKKDEAFVSIFNKSMCLMDYEIAKYKGVKNAPELDNITNTKLMYVVIIIGIALFIAVFILYWLLKIAINQKAETEILKEKEHLMYTDALTGLYNRQYFNDLKDKMNDKEFPQGFIMMDLNKLKYTNDTYGHHAGDLLIQEFSKIISTHINHEHVMRMGGDEFFAFLEGTKEEAIKEVVNEIMHECKASKVFLKNDWSIEGPSASIGYAIRYDSKAKIGTMLHKADQYMYKMKLSNK
jgi:diguanylate cyclase (GGDEF)-like protein